MVYQQPSVVLLTTGWCHSGPRSLPYITGAGFPLREDGAFETPVCLLLGLLHVLIRSAVSNTATLGAVAHQAPLSMGFSKAGTLEQVAMSFFSIFATQGSNLHL